MLPSDQLSTRSTARPGNAPPMSSRCAEAPAKPTSSPSWKIGITIATSGECVAPRYGSLWRMTSPSWMSSPRSRRTPFTIFGIAPMNIGVESDSASSLPSASKMPAPRSSDSRMIDEYDIRKRTPDISLAIEANAPPITRMRIGVASSARAISAPVVQSMTMLPCRSISAVSPGVTAVGEAADEAPIRGDAVGLQLSRGLRRELVEPRREPPAVEGLERVPLGRHELVLEVGGEEPGGGGDPGVGRYEHPRNLEL